MHSNSFPIAAAILTLLAFAFVNVDGQPVHVVRFPLHSRNPNRGSISNYKLQQKRVFNTGDGNWLHGWPFAGLLRPGAYPIGRKGDPTALVFKAPRGLYSRWPIDNSPWHFINVYALALNALIAIFVSWDTYLRVRDTELTRFRFSTSSLLIAMLVVAILTAWRNLFLDTHDMCETIALFVVTSSTIVTLVSVPIRIASLVRAEQNHATQETEV